MSVRAEAKLRLGKRFSLALLALLLASSSIPLSRAQGAGAAVFEAVRFEPKVYEGEEVSINATVRNLAVAPPGGEAPKFFLRALANNLLVYDGFSSAWGCPPGSKASREVILAGLEGPREYSMRLELYWLNGSFAILEDVYRFKLTVVKLFVAGWSPSPSSVQAGAASPTELKVAFRNGGNDAMLNVSLAVVEALGLNVTPKALKLGDLGPGESRSASFLVSAPKGLGLGPRRLPIQVSYFDFRGVGHVETFEAEIQIVRLGTKLELLAPSTAAYKTSVTLVARLFDVNGEPVPGAQITFYLDSKPLGSNATDALGAALLVFAVESPVGSHELKAEYAGSGSLNASSASTILTVSKAQTRIALSAPGSGKVGQGVPVEIKLLDGLGRPIQAAPILVSVDSQPLSRLLTGEDGVARLVYKPEAKGDHEIEAVYEGGENYAGSRASRRIAVEPIKTEVALFANSPTFHGKPIEVKATLTDEFGKPVPGAPVTFSFSLGGETKYRKTVVTDGSGVALLTYNPPSPGSLRVEASFPGSKKFSGSSASLSVTLVAPGMILGLLGLVSAAFAATFLLYAGKSASILNFFRRFGALARGGGGPPGPPPAGLRLCSSCGAEIPMAAVYCDKCGARQVGPQLAELDERVLSYIASRGGTISVARAVQDLGITRETLMESIDRLRRAGRLEPIE